MLERLRMSSMFFFFDFGTEFELKIIIWTTIIVWIVAKLEFLDSKHWHSTKFWMNWTAEYSVKIRIKCRRNLWRIGNDFWLLFRVFCENWVFFFSVFEESQKERERKGERANESIEFTLTTKKEERMNMVLLLLCTKDVRVQCTRMERMCVKGDGCRWCTYPDFGWRMQLCARVSVYVRYYAMSEQCKARQNKEKKQRQSQK